METILQFGAGNFLRAFVDTFVSEMNAAGQNVGKIVVVQTTGDDRARLLNAQNRQFHVVVRGQENGVAVDQTQTVTSISRALSSGTEWEKVVEAACAPALRAVVSNTTEAGFALNSADDGASERDGAPRSFPAKLLALLRALLFEEIVPTVEDAVPDARAYAEATLERFANPFLEHKLADIALYHETKVGIRLAPTREAFRVRFGREPRLLGEILG